MTTHEIGQRAPSRHARRKRRRNYGPVIILALVCAAIFAAGYCVGVSAADKAVPTLPEPVLESSATPEPSAEPSVAPTPSPTPEAVLWRNDIVTDGNLLDYDLQVTMQACCEEYGVPYALALAVADVESRFDPDAASSTNDYGLMQINQVNHGWLLEQGINPMTPAGNIEAGVLFLSDYLTAYGDPELAVMAYNCGPSGAQNLWAAGTYSTDHSRKVMDRFDYVNALPVFKRGRTFYIEVINPVHYASYVEFGHRTPGGKGWVAGQYFLTLAESQLESRAPAIIEKELEKKLKEVFKV